MPAPDKDLFTQLAQSNFAGLGIELPADWEEPGSQFPDAFAASEISASPVAPTNLFQQATLNQYHVDSATDIGELLATYLEGICGATCDGIDQWMSAASIATVIIAGPVGTLTPGGVVGPPLMPLIMASAPTETEAELNYSTAIADAVSTGWQAWQTGLMGTLMYPALLPSPAQLPHPLPVRV